jgi:[glutamine synthetase] adenylyltransferase / [glutamine synthetase]-adenylyl-L-tyrosine phosphorylase
MAGTSPAMTGPLGHGSLLAAVRDLPAPADAQAEATAFARWRDAAAEAGDPALAAFMLEIAADPAGRALLAALFGNSPFLTQCCLAEPAFVRELVEAGPDRAFARIKAALGAPDLWARERSALMAELRRLRRRAALLIAIADVANLWPLEKVTRSLSDVAEGALEAAVRHLLAAAAAGGEIEPAGGDPAGGDDPAHGSGFIVLGMGKLGAFELNYSSDIDLILLYDAERVRYRGRRSEQHFFNRLAQDLVRIISERTEDGYVFRTDLRLRPDPGSTPPVVALEAALIYYESAGQNWERAALIKARPVAGDRRAGAEFLAELTPFLWRRHLDFAAIQDIHSIKRQIDAHRGGGVSKVAGHDVKLGRGGIREIEFFAQTQQLIWGGRVPSLRESATCDALAALARVGRITEEAACELTRCYGFLRRVEHRLQMVNDAQTHTLPDDAAGLDHIARFLGFAGRDDFADAMRGTLGTVEGHYARLFEEAPTLSAEGNLVFTGIEDDPETLETVRRLGFSDPVAVSSIVRGWHHGRYRAMRSQRARELMTELIPTLLREFGVAANPDGAFVNFDRFLARIPAGVQLLSLFANNPPLMALVAEIMGTGPRLADEVTRRPNLLDFVLEPGFFDAPPSRAQLHDDLEALLARANHYEDVLSLARRWVAERRFQIGVQLLRRRLDGEAAGAAFSDVADAALSCLLPQVTAEFARSHGAVPGGGLVVLGLGKLGSREMTVTSDLDLILIYDAPDTSEGSVGPRPLPVSTYFIRLTQRYINALTALTEDGNLYDVDMRLRPSGAKGPVALSLVAFRRYHDESAWTWEQMSLTRARAVAGPRVLASQIMATVRELLRRPRDADRLVADVDDMRRRIAEQHRAPETFDLKHRSGGMVDIEFIAQYLQLRWAADHPFVLCQNTHGALAALASAQVLPRAAEIDLARSLRLWRNVQSLLKLVANEPFDQAAAAPQIQALLAAGADAVDFADLLMKIEEAAAMAHGWYERLVASPAQAVARSEPAPHPREEEHAP